MITYVFTGVLFIIFILNLFIENNSVVWRRLFLLISLLILILLLHWLFTRMGIFEPDKLQHCQIGISHNNEEELDFEKKYCGSIYIHVFIEKVGRNKK